MRLWPELNGWSIGWQRVCDVEHVRRPRVCTLAQRPRRVCAEAGSVNSSTPGWVPFRGHSITTLDKSSSNRYLPTRLWPLSARIVITVSVSACRVDVAFPPFSSAGSQGGHHGQLNINITRTLPAQRSVQRQDEWVDLHASCPGRFNASQLPDRPSDRNPAANVRRPKVDHESRTLGLDRNELGGLLVQAGLAPMSPGGGARVRMRIGCWSGRRRVSMALGARC